jgi:hypothetical protein
MIMENTNDKMTIANDPKFRDLVLRYRNDDDTMTNWLALVMHVDVKLGARAEEARREGEALGRASMREHIETVVRERDRAWQRTHHLQEQILAATQRTAGGDIDNDEFWALVIAYCRGVGREGAALVDYVQRWGASKVRDALRLPEDALRKNGFTKIDDVWVPPPVAEAAAQADDGEHFSRVAAIVAGWPEWKRSQLLTKYSASAPTAQPTPEDPDWMGKIPHGFDAVPAAQPTPPDDERLTGLAALGWTAMPATPDDERAAFPEHKPRLGRHEHTYENPADWDDGYVEGWNDCVDAARAALRQPGAPAKPLTRRDINFVKQPPGVIALTLAILWHDGAERPLYTRDGQIAWTGIDAGGHEKSVTVGQLREVLVAALGLPVGTKFGG